MRSNEELKQVLISVLEHYEELRKSGVHQKTCMSMVLRTYDDFGDWVYERGSFQ